MPQKLVTDGPPGCETANAQDFPQDFLDSQVERRILYWVVVFHVLIGGGNIKIMLLFDIL
jgi:hypothetical protein